MRADSTFKWSIQATTNLTARLSPEDLKLLHRAGLHQICQGAESGSKKVWKAMNKDFQDFPTIYESAARCLAAGIRPSFNIIFAFPGEGQKERNETISFKHLPVFHQVDGIIIDEEANLASLMGTLQEFYSKMGFGRVKFKPAFYPYTEPSVDVVVYMESRGKWIEMGGAGIFRPEVTLPLGCKFPVLAWGLGIERLAMIRCGVSDIRELYGTSLNELEKVPLCR